MTRTAKVVSIRNGQEIPRTTAELRRAFLENNASGDVSLRLKALLTAYLDTEAISDETFRLIFGQTMHGNPDGTNITVSNETMAILLNRSLATIKRGNKQAEEAGYYTKKQRKYDSSVRTFGIPADAMDRIVREVQGSSDLSFVKPKKAQKCASSTKEAQICASSKIEEAQICTAGSSDLSPYPSFLTLGVVEVENTNAATEIASLLEVQPKSENCVERANRMVTSDHIERFTKEAFTWGMLAADASMQTGFHNHRDYAKGKLIEAIAVHADGFSDSVTIKALTVALTAMEGENFDHAMGVKKAPYKGSKNGISYFVSTLNKKLAEFKKAERMDKAEAIEIADKTAANVQGNRKAVDMKLGSLQSVIAANGAARIASNGHAKASASPAPAGRFPDAQTVETISGTRVDGFKANMILDAVEGCTVNQVCEQLIKASGSSRFQRKEFAPAPAIADVIAWCISELKTASNLEKYGTPESLAGGKAAKFGGNDLKTSWCVLTQAFIDGLTSKYPLWPTIERRAGKDEILYYSMSAKIKDEMVHVTGESYGKDSQRKVEEKVEGIFKSAHDNNERAIERQKEYEKEKACKELKDRMDREALESLVNSSASETGIKIVPNAFDPDGGYTCEVTSEFDEEIKSKVLSQAMLPKVKEIINRHSSLSSKQAKPEVIMDNVRSIRDTVLWYIENFNEEFAKTFNMESANV